MLMLNNAPSENVVTIDVAVLVVIVFCIGPIYLSPNPQCTTAPDWFTAQSVNWNSIVGEIISGQTYIMLAPPGCCM